MVELVNQNGSYRYTVFESLSCFLVQIITANGKDLLLLTRQLTARPVTLAAVGESYNDPKDLLGRHTIETGVPVLMEILHHIVFECLNPFLIEVLML